MYLKGTPLDIIHMLPIVIETVILLFQIIRVLERPHDKKRIQYLFLLIFLLLYNTSMSMLPEPRIPIASMLQVVIAYGIASFMSMSFAFYFYKSYNLVRLKFLATHGLIIFIFAPYVFLFVVPYYLTQDIELSRRLTTAIPALYSVVFVTWAIRAFISNAKEGKTRTANRDEPILAKIIPASVSLICWAAMPVVVFLDIPEVDRIILNAGFLVLTASYIHTSIKNSKKEYSALQNRTSAITNFAYETEPALRLIDHYLQDTGRNASVESEEKLALITANLQRVLEKLKVASDHGLHTEATDLSLLIRTKIALLKEIAAANNVEITERIEPGIIIQDHLGNADRLISMLVENSVRNANSRGDVDFTLSSDGVSALFSVIENSIKITVTVPLTTNPAPSSIKTSSIGRSSILIVENNPASLESIVAKLTEKFHVNVAQNHAEALDVLNNISRLDLIVVDSQDGDRFRQEVSAKGFKGTPFLFLTDPKLLSGPTSMFVESGATGYVARPIVLTEMMEKIDSLMTKFNSEKESLRVAYRSLSKPPSPDRKPLADTFADICKECSLSPREIEVLSLLNMGNSHKEIGDKLNIAKNTVDTHVGNIFKKVRDTFGHDAVSSRVDLLNVLGLRGGHRFRDSD